MRKSWLAVPVIAPRLVTPLLPKILSESPAIGCGGFRNLGALFIGERAGGDGERALIASPAPATASMVPSLTAEPPTLMLTLAVAANSRKSLPPRPTRPWRW